MISVRLPDGSKREFDSAVTVAQVAASIGAGLAKAALAGKVNGKLVDTSHLIEADVDLSIITDKDANGLDVIRHSTAHLLAYAVKELFPEARFNAWSVGELHVIDPRIIPNGRRDHFEQSVHFHNLLTHLAPVAREITRKCRTSSIQRKWSRHSNSNHSQ